MNQKQIKEEVCRYLEDTNYRYAILIDGAWGCGKTYFVLNDLKNAIETHENNSTNRILRYISLYGCKSVEELEENICWSIVDEKFYEKYDKIAQANFVYGDKKKKIKQKGEIICNVSKKVIGMVMQKFDISGKAYEYVADFFTMDKNIFIFDDLERCDCSINDIFGYINGLVEHEGVKVILVANEREIGRLSRTERKELQYIVSAIEEIKIPQEESPFSYGRNIQKNELDVEELERRRKKIFEDVEYDQQYTSIREKLIGITMQYESDFSTIMHKLIGCCGNDENWKNVLNSRIKYFMDTMHIYEHQNLRTFQFFLSKIGYLYNKFQCLEIAEKYKQDVLIFLIENCFMLCVEFKGNIEEPEEQFAKICFQNKRRMSSINNYVRQSVFNKQDFQIEIDRYIDSELSGKVSSDDPYYQLYNEYYIKTQEWVEEKIEQVLYKLQNNEYDLGIYPKFLLLLIRLKKYGFSETYLSKASELMLKNIQNGAEPKHILDNSIPSDDGKEIEECREIINKLNKEIRKAKENFRQKDIQMIIENEKSWAKKLETYWEENKNNMPFEALFISKVDEDIWVKSILESDAENINFFRQCLDCVYPKNVIRANLDEDMRVINNVIEKLKEHTEDDLIKRMQLGWLIEQLLEIYNRHMRNGQKN